MIQKPNKLITTKPSHSSGSYRTIRIILWVGKSLLKCLIPTVETNVVILDHQFIFLAMIPQPISYLGLLTLSFLPLKNLYESWALREIYRDFDHVCNDSLLFKIKFYLSRTFYNSVLKNQNFSFRQGSSLPPH